MDAAVRVGGLTQAKKCITEELMLVGAEGYSSVLFAEIAQAYIVPHRPGHMDTKVRIINCH